MLQFNKPGHFIWHNLGSEKKSMAVRTVVVVVSREVRILFIDRHLALRAQVHVGSSSTLKQR